MTDTVRSMVEEDEEGGWCQREKWRRNEKKRTGDKLLKRAAALLHERRESAMSVRPTFLSSSPPNSCLPRVS